MGHSLRQPGGSHGDQDGLRPLRPRPRRLHRPQRYPLPHPELKEAINALGIEAKAAAVYQMIAELDQDGSGQIEFDEFYEMMTHRPNEQ